MAPIGRFAPSPSGPLHFGSLVAALASYCQARAQQGQWLLRIEDVDTPRVVAGATTASCATSNTSVWNGTAPVMYQSERFELVPRASSSACGAGRLLRLRMQPPQPARTGRPSGPLGQIYPGNCRAKTGYATDHSIRLNTAGAGNGSAFDAGYGEFEMDLPGEVGDFVLRRVDDIYAYHLAVVVDDELQGIDEIVRGADLLENTCLHLFLQQTPRLRTPDYLHLPLVNNADGVKLSKQTGALALDPDNASTLLRHVAGVAPSRAPTGADRTRSPAMLIDRSARHGAGLGGRQLESRADPGENVRPPPKPLECERSPPPVRTRRRDRSTRGEWVYGIAEPCQEIKIFFDLLDAVDGQAGIRSAPADRRGRSNRPR